MNLSLCAGGLDLLCGEDEIHMSSSCAAKASGVLILP